MSYRDEVFDVIDSTDLKDSNDVLLTLKYLAEELCKYYGIAMRMPHMTDLYVRDKHSGRIFRIGDDWHDQLTISEDGRLHYYNLQNGDGCVTGYDGDVFGYEFVPNEDEYGYSMDPREVDDR